MVDKVFEWQSSPHIPVLMIGNATNVINPAVIFFTECATIYDYMKKVYEKMSYKLS